MVDSFNPRPSEASSLSGGDFKMEAYIAQHSVTLQSNTLQDNRLKRLSCSFDDFDDTAVTIDFEDIACFYHLCGYACAGHRRNADSFAE